MASTAFPPKGDPLTKPIPANLPSKTQIITTTIHPTIHHSASCISLVPLNLSHAEDLFTNLGGPQNAHLWTYMLSNGPLTLEQFTTNLETILAFPNWQNYTVFSSSPHHLSNQNRTPSTEPKSTAIAMISLLNIQAAHLSVEVGHVLFPVTCQRSSESTAIHYLLMRYVFEDLGFERVEWKCNSQNAPSKRAATRLGYKHEGVFRRHMVLKEVWRDSWWASMLGGEWEGGAKQALESWLDEKNFDGEGNMRKKLESFRKEFAQGSSS